MTAGTVCVSARKLWQRFIETRAECHMMRRMILVSDAATVDTAQGRTTITLEIDTSIANILVDRTSRFLSWVARQRRSSAALLLFERRHKP